MSRVAGTFLPENSATPSKPRDKRVEQGAASREEILDAAERLMGIRGYDGTSIATISRESGLPNSSIYWHFNSKAGVVAAVMERGAERFFATVSPTEREPDESPGAYIHRHLLASLNVAVTQSQFWRLLVLLLLSNDNPDVTAIVQQVRGRARTLLREVLQTAYAGSGEQQADNVADALTDYLLAAYDGILLAIQADPHPSLEVLAAQLAGSVAVLAEDIVEEH